MRHFLLLLLLAATSLSAMSRLTATADTVDFGLIREADGPKQLRFYLRNDGDGPEGILRVKPTCGCTAADFSHDEIMPGDSVWIDLTYNPFRRPGYFEKAVKVYPAHGEMLRVNIRGTVMASEETLDNMYPVDGGLLRLSEKSLMALTPLTDNEKHFSVNLYNAGDNPVWTLLKTDNPSVIFDIFPYPYISPGEKGTIEITILPDESGESGARSFPLYLYMADDPSHLESAPPLTLTVTTPPKHPPHYAPS